MNTQENTNILTAKTFKEYRHKLKLMDTIHNEVATKINAIRQANDRYFIPEVVDNNHFALMMDTYKP